MFEIAMEEDGSYDEKPIVEYLGNSFSGLALEQARSSAFKCVWKNWYLYKLQIVQELFGQDFINFMKKSGYNNAEILDIFFNEATFCLNSCV